MAIPSHLQFYNKISSGFTKMNATKTKKILNYNIVSVYGINQLVNVQGTNVKMRASTKYEKAISIAPKGMEHELVAAVV